MLRGGAGGRERENERVRKREKGRGEEDRREGERGKEGESVKRRGRERENDRDRERKREGESERREESLSTLSDSIGHRLCGLLQKHVARLWRDTLPSRRVNLIALPSPALNLSACAQKKCICDQ